MNIQSHFKDSKLHWKINLNLKILLLLFILLFSSLCLAKENTNVKIISKEISLEIPNDIKTILNFENNFSMFLYRDKSISISYVENKTVFDTYKTLLNIEENIKLRATVAFQTVEEDSKNIKTINFKNLDNKYIIKSFQKTGLSTEKPSTSFILYKKKEDIMIKIEMINFDKETTFKILNSVQDR